MNETTIIDGREYTVEPLPTGEAAKQGLLANGWAPQCYALTGKRGAMYLGYKSLRTGKFCSVVGVGGKRAATAA